MRGNGETLQDGIDAQTSKIAASTESTTTTADEISNPDFFQSIGNFFMSIQKKVSDFFSNIVKSVFGAENENQVSPVNETYTVSDESPAPYIGSNDFSISYLYDTDSGSFMFRFNDVDDSKYYRGSPLNIGFVKQVEDGYILTCEILEYNEISYEDYQILSEKVCLD